MRLSYFIFLLFIFIYSIQGAAQAPSKEINILTDSINCERYILEDTTGKFSIADVTSAKVDSLFRKPVIADILKDHGVFWIKFLIKKKFPETVFLETRPTHKSTIFFIPLGSGKYAIQKDGFNYPFQKKQFKANSTLFPVTSSEANKNYYYVRIELSSFWGPSLYFHSLEYTFNRLIRNYFFGRTK